MLATFEPFVGRAPQLQQLRAWASEVASTGVGRFVLVTGEAGAGKSRLCAEFARQLPRSQVSVASWWCWPDGDGPPLSPWPDLALDLEQQSGRSVDALPDFGSRDRFDLFRAIRDHLRESCLTRPGVAVLDDLHAANPDVALLTRFIARALHRLPMLIVATWRIEPSAADSRFDVVAREANVMPLPPFSAPDVGAFLASFDRPDASAEEIAELLDATGGNPMYVAELVRYPSTDTASRAGLALALAARVARLAVRPRRILGAAALLGDGATIAETAIVAGCTPGEVVDVINDLASGASVVAGEIRFAHDLLRGAFVAALSVQQRQLFHVAARDIIQGSEVAPVVRRAHHAVEAALLAPEHVAAAVAACRTAATSLLGSFAFEQAVQWAATGCRLAAGTTSQAEECELLLVHADAVRACGRRRASRELYVRALRSAEEARDVALLARATLGIGGAWVEEEPDEVSRRRLLGLCRRALIALEPDERLLRARLKVRVAAELAYDDASSDEVRRAVEEVRQLGDPAALAEALSLYHHTLMAPEHASTRLAIADELLDVAVDAEPSIYSLFGLCWRTVDLYLVGRHDADRAFFELRERATALRNQAIGYIVAVIDVMRAFRRGELEAIESMAAEALTLGDAAGDTDAIAFYGGHLLALRWVQGRLQEMQSIVMSVIESSTLRRRDRVYPAVLAYATAASGDHDRARSLLDDVLADGIDAIPTFPNWSTTIAVLTETAAELSDTELAAAIAERFAPVAHLPVMPSFAIACLGPGERVQARALATAGRLDDAVQWFRAALDANRRLQNRPVGAIVRAELAETLLRRARTGDDREAAELLRAAIAEARAMGLTRRVEQWTAVAAASPATARCTPSIRGELVRGANAWRIAISDRVAVIEHAMGFSYIAELIARPDTDIAASELGGAVVGGVTVDPGPSVPTLDARARDDYRRRLAALERELDRADLVGDSARGRRAAEEREQIIDALRRDTGLGGRPRRMTDEAERSRMRVSKAIRRALQRLSTVDPFLGRALEARIRTGYFCCYVTDPDQPIDWTVRRHEPTGPAGDPSP